MAARRWRAAKASGSLRLRRGATYNDSAHKVMPFLTSSATVLADDPALTVRWSELDEQTQALYPQQNLRQPVRIVIDSQNRVTPEHRIVQQPGETLVRAYAGRF